MPEITFGIIGTAGREDDGRRLSKKHFDAMYVIADELITQVSESNYPITHLVSGGAAWADHIAIKLFLDKKIPNLRLYIPCQWDNGQYEVKQEKDPGSIANYYHKKFQTATNIHSLSQIQCAFLEGAQLLPCRGFHARNAMVAKSDFLLAMTFGKGKQVKDGGTAHTVKCYLDRVRKEGIFDKSFHYDLNAGTVHTGCELPPEDDLKKTESLLRKNPRVNHLLGKGKLMNNPFIIP